MFLREGALAVNISQCAHSRYRLSPKSLNAARDVCFYTRFKAVLIVRLHWNTILIYSEKSLSFKCDMQQDFTTLNFLVEPGYAGFCAAFLFADKISELTKELQSLKQGQQQSQAGLHFNQCHRDISTCSACSMTKLDSRRCRFVFRVAKQRNGITRIKKTDESFAKRYR